MSRRVGIDTGGTFTDLVAAGEDGLRVAKTLSTRQEPIASTRAALARAGLGEAGQVETLVHSTTIATNALIERRGAVVGLITTQGFKDVLQIQRINRPRSFDLGWVRNEPLVPRHLVREVAERVTADGSVLVPLDEQAVATAAADLVAAGADAIAICFLFSFLDAAHERRAGEIVAAAHPGVAVSTSSGVFGQWREYERASTCVVDAFLKPTVDRYAGDLDALGRDQAIGRLSVLRSNGGTMNTQGARDQPISMVRSGPAGGVVASTHVGRAVGIDNLMIADMGGTSFDTGLVHAGEAELTTEAELAWGIPLCVPMVDVRSVGAGGGSIAWLDAAGILKVGPQSAGSEPGPACYGRGGTAPTVTDANVVLGRLPDDLPLAGSLRLDAGAARAALAGLAAQMGRTLEEVALGILQIADNNMAQALRLVSIDRGRDPREFALIAFGGAGPLHSGELARALSIGRVVVPPLPGAFSALGALMADTRFDYATTLLTDGAAADLPRIEAAYQRLEERAREDLAREGIGDEAVFARAVELRYRGQNWELEVPVDGTATAATLAAAGARFHAAHEQQFGWNEPAGELELVNFKLTVSAARAIPAFPAVPERPLPQPIAVRTVGFRGIDGGASAPVYWREELGAGNVVDGPAIVAETICTTLLHPGDRLTVHPSGTMIVDIAQEAAA